MPVSGPSYVAAKPWLDMTPPERYDTYRAAVAEIERLRTSADRVLEHLALGEDVPVDAYEDLRAVVESAP